MGDAVGLLDLPDTVRVKPQTAELIANREKLMNAAAADEEAAKKAAGYEVDAAEVATGLTPAGHATSQKLPSHSLDSRCEVNPGGRRGVVRYIGCVGGLPKPLIGVELD